MESLKLLERDLPAKNKLSILMLLADGRLGGFRFAFDNDLDIEKIKAEIAESESYIANPDFAGGAMKLGAGPRTYKDGYLSALRESLAMITATRIDYTSRSKINAELSLAEKPESPYGDPK